MRRTWQRIPQANRGCALLLDDISRFNFLLPNLRSSGVHQVDVAAWLDTDMLADQGSASCAATIGLGSMIIQVLRLVNGDEGNSELTATEIQ